MLTSEVNPLNRPCGEIVWSITVPKDMVKSGLSLTDEKFFFFLFAIETGEE